MTESSRIRWEKDAEGVVTLTLDDPEQSANTMNPAFQRSLEAVVGRLVSEKESIAGVIVTSAKKTFFAGGDLKVLVQATPEVAPEMFEALQGMKKQLRTLETLGKPVVAALNGSALGGGLEIALACHRRIAIDDGKSEFGFPEVTLGLLPGAGGVARTVRLLGLQAALMDWLMQGQRYRPADAKAKGLVHELVPDATALLAAAREFIRNNAAAKQPWDEGGYKMPGGTPSTPALAMMLPAFPSNLKKQLKGANYPAPKAILAAAVEGAQVDFETATRIESRYFVGLATGKVAKNMIQAFFFDLQKINGGASRPKDIPVWKPARVGILGAGMMGQGVAYVTARAGIPCVLKDVTLEGAEKGKGYSRKLLDKLVQKGKMTAQAAETTLSLITPAASAKDLAGCDMIIEAVFEDRDLKARVTAEAEENGAPGLLMCSNTSTLPITGLAKASKDARNFIGLHFFSPVDKMPLVEIIAGEQTSPEALAKAFDYVLAIKKTPIVVNDSRGFFTSRVFGMFMNEGISMVGEGYSPQSIEQAALQAGMPVGPLAVCDEVSLELTRHVRAQTRKDLEAEGKTLPSHPADAVVDRMVTAFNRKGKAAGAGFYDYPADGKKTLWPGLREHFVKPALAAPTTEAFQEMQDRMLYMFSLESIRCLEEKVLRSVADANVGSIFGIGQPPWTGGALQYVNYVGLGAFASRARELARKYGPRFEPPRLLETMAAAGDTFR